MHPRKTHAVVICLHTLYTDGTVDRKLVFSKTRVELLGAVILAKLMNTVSLSLQPVFTSELQLFYCHTPSYVCWVKNIRPYIEEPVSSYSK